MTDNTEESWYIIKKATNQCDIVSADALETINQPEASAPPSETWGPFTAKNQAIAKRIGLIRAGKCQPVR